MPICPWCEKEVIVRDIVDHPLPDDDSIEICVKCSFESQEKDEARFVTPRLKTQERNYARV